MAISTTNGTTSLQKPSDLLDKRKFLAIGSVINKIRIVQGWNMITPKDAEPVARVWIEQLDRYNIAPQLYDTLLNRCIDRRAAALKEGEQTPPLTVELFLAEFEIYRNQVYSKFNSAVMPIRDLEFSLHHNKQALQPFEPKTPTAPPNEFESDHKKRWEMPVPPVEKQKERYDSTFAECTRRAQEKGFVSLDAYVKHIEAEIGRHETAARKIWSDAFMLTECPKTRR
jgi:hypothetical protein